MQVQLIYLHIEDNTNLKVFFDRTLSIESCIIMTVPRMSRVKNVDSLASSLRPSRSVGPKQVSEKAVPGLQR